MIGDIVYNNNSLQTSGIRVSEIRHHSSPMRRIVKHRIAGASKSKFVSSEYPEKSINISGQFSAASIALTDALEDTLKGYLIGMNKNLDIEHNSGTRRYIATPAVVNIDRPGGLMYGNFEVDFDLSLPFGTDISETTLATVLANTLATRTIAVSIGGSAEYQYPVTTVTINSGTDLSNRRISIGNTLNGQVINITRNWMAGDVLVIDPYNDLFTVNGVEVAFTGAPPIFGTGTGGVTYEDTFLTRNVDIVVKHYRMWM